MRKSLLTALVLLSSAFSSAQTQSPTPTLHGNLIYTRTWGAEDASKAGIYQFNADATGDVILEYRPEGSNIYGRFYKLTDCGLVA